MADIVGEPVERLLVWAFARTVERALWAVMGDDVADGHDMMADAAVLARIAGL